VKIHSGPDPILEFPRASDSGDGKMRDELLNGEVFLLFEGEDQVLNEMWRKQYTTIRPHSALDYRPPAPAAMLIEQPSQFEQLQLP